MNQKINIPDSVHDMNISHLKFYLELRSMAGDDVSESFINDLEPVQVSDLNALFFSKDQGAFDIYDDKSNRLVLAEILISSNKYKLAPLINEITVDGIDYVLNLDFTKQPVSFHRDLSNLNLEDNPDEILGMMYIEKGMVYNEVDKSIQIINSRIERAKKLNPHFNLAQFLDLQGFFLSSCSALEPYLSKKQRSKARQPKRNGIGKSQ